MKPSDISSATWKAAEDHIRAYSYLLSSTEIVARAMMAATEREKQRCAAVARGATKVGNEPISLTIETAILQGSQPSTSIPHLGTVKS